MTLEEAFGDWLKVIDRQELFKVVKQINVLYNQSECAPAYKNIFKVFQVTPYRELKVVMLFQDPYPQKGVATGIALGNEKTVTELSPSLNVVKEAVINFEILHNFCTFDPSLEEWSRQGILLLNTALTVQIGKPGSHSVYWRHFIAKLLHNISIENPGLIYVLWGNSAKSFEHHILKTSAAKIIKMQHPAFYARNNLKIPYSFFTNLKKLVKYYWDSDLELFHEITFND